MEYGRYFWIEVINGSYLWISVVDGGYLWISVGDDAKTVLKLTRGIVGGIPLAAASSHQAETIRVTPNIRTWSADVIIDHLGGMLGVTKGGKIPEETSKAQFSAQILTTVPNFGPGRRRRSFSLEMEKVMYTSSFGHKLLPFMVVILRSQISVKFGHTFADWNGSNSQ